jgi:hypothetical protein
MSFSRQKSSPQNKKKKPATESLSKLCSVYFQLLIKSDASGIRVAKKGLSLYCEISEKF